MRELKDNLLAAKDAQHVVCLITDFATKKNLDVSTIHQLAGYQAGNFLYFIFSIIMFIVNYYI